MVTDEISDKIKAWIEKAKGLPSEIWESTKRESRETREAVKILDRIVKGEEVSLQQKQFLKAQLIDIVKIIPLIAIKGIPVPIPITPILIIVGKKIGFNFLPDSHEKSDYKF